MARRSREALVLLAVGGVLLIAATADARKKKKCAKVTLPTSTQTDKVQTGGHDVAAWATSRFAAALAEVKKTETDDATARDIALSLLTHWSIETANGAAEWNYNVGNITATGQQTWYLAHDISGCDLAFRAFADLASGVAAYVALLGGARYKVAAYELAHDPTKADWWIALGKAGWFDPTKAKPPSTWDQAAASFAARRASLAQYATASEAST